jgi:hypothetical protein
MRNKQEIPSSAVVTKKPPKKEVSDAEFRRKLKNIAQWRKQRLAELRTKNLLNR